MPWGGFVEVLLTSGLLLATPLLLAALGEAIAERAGLLNLGIEGTMLLGAFAGFHATVRSGSFAAGIGAGIAAGAVLGLVFGVLAVGLRVDQVLVGLAITVFGAGLSGFLFRDLHGGQTASLPVVPPEAAIPWLRDLPVAGEALFGQQVLVYAAFGLVPVGAFVLRRTRFGLEVRAVGEDPFAADASGVAVARVRYLAIVIGGAAAGLAGAFLAVADLKRFEPGMTVGQGFIALAITMLGRWDPWRIAVGALLFGLLRSLGYGLQILGVDVQPEFVGMLPYLGVVVGLIVLAGRTALPAALGVPYERGRR